MTDRHMDLSVDPEQVRAVATDLAPGGTVTAGWIACRLGKSTRTLQPQLAKQGVSLRALIVESCLKIARVLLCKTDLDVQEIAARTGYSKPNSFVRAFGSWAGCSPGSFSEPGRASVHK